MIPQGVATFLPEAAYLKRVIEREILTIFFRWGYQEIITPIFEYLDVVSVGIEEGVLEKGYKIVDRANGRVMILRPDVTPQVARMVAMLFSEHPKPLRLCYRENVFRHEGEHEGREREVFQVGGELIGLSGPEADAEMIGIAVQSLTRLGLSDFKVILGQIEISRNFIEKTGLSKDGKKQLQEALIKKDVGVVKGILKSSKMSKKEQKKFLELVGLIGGEKVLKEAAGLISNPTSRKALKNLGDVFSLLKYHGVEDRVMIDLGEIRGLEYYTGVFYEVFAEGVGYEIGRGGRYDNLIAKFGSAYPSTGFAFDLERLELALECQGRHLPFSTADLLFAGPRKHINQIILAARKLRNQGYRVIHRVCDGESHSVLRSYAQSMGIPGILLVEGEKEPKLVIVNTESGKKRKGSLKEIGILKGKTFWK